MVQTTAIAASALREYSAAVESAYREEMLEQVEAGQQLARQREISLSLHRQQILDQQASEYGLDDTIKSKLANAIRQNILQYLKKAVDSAKQQWGASQQTALTNSQENFDLQQETTNQIDQVVWLDEYDRNLFREMQANGFSLTQATNNIAASASNLVNLGLKIPLLDNLQALPSESDVNYVRLWRRLQQQKWKAANQETLRCLVAASKQSKDSQTIDTNRLPLTDLRTIDQLWRKYSQNRFGFSVQLEIWQAVQSKDPAERVEAFGRKVGWRRINSWISYEAVDFSLKAERGHLPAFPHLGWWCWAGHMQKLMDGIAPAPMSQNVLSLSA